MLNLLMLYNNKYFLAISASLSFLGTVIKPVEPDGSFISDLLAATCELITDEDVLSLSVYPLTAITRIIYHRLRAARWTTQNGSPTLSIISMRSINRITTLSSTCHFVLSLNGISHVVQTARRWLLPCYLSKLLTFEK